MMTPEKLNLIHNWPEADSSKELLDEVDSLEPIDVLNQLELNLRRVCQLSSRLAFLLTEVKDLIIK